MSQDNTAPFGDWRQPTLASENVLLRPLAEDDFDALFAISSDKLVWAMHPAHDRWKEPVFREFFEAALHHKGAIVMIDRGTGAIFGTSRWQGVVEKTATEPSSVEIGWTFLARSHWGGTWNREVKRLMIGHALQHVEVVEFHVGENNLRSRRAMEKIGGVATDRPLVVDMVDGPVRHVIYEISREAFETGPLKN